jgi:hypothetical protein
MREGYKTKHAADVNCGGNVPARRIGILVRNPYPAASKAALAFLTTRAGIPCERPAAD